MANGFSPEAQQSMIWKFASKIMAQMVFVERPEKISFYDWSESFQVN